MQQEWWAEGELFESCNCNLLCPCHVSFRQPGTNPNCDSIWAVNIESGRYGDVELAGLGVVAFAHCPGPTMFDGDWTAVLFIDDRATGPQRDALEAVFSGEAGGPWAGMARFYRDGKYVAIREMPLDITIDARSKSIKASDQLFMEVNAIRGADREGLATLSNLRNVIHGPEHVLARSNFKVDAEGLSWEEESKHGLYSKFKWSGP